MYCFTTLQMLILSSAILALRSRHRLRTAETVKQQTTSVCQQLHPVFLTSKEEEALIIIIMI